MDMTTSQPIYTNPVYTTTYFEAPNAQFDGTASDGTIELLNYENNLDENWEISPSCSSVWIHSTLLYVENNYDFLYIGDEQFTDTGCIDQLYDTPVSVRFTSDGSINKDGFTLHWSCDQTGLGTICDSDTTGVVSPTQEVTDQTTSTRLFCQSTVQSTVQPTTSTTTETVQLDLAEDPILDPEDTNESSDNSKGVSVLLNIFLLSFSLQII